MFHSYDPIGFDSTFFARLHRSKYQQRKEYVRRRRAPKEETENKHHNLDGHSSISDNSIVRQDEDFPSEKGVISPPEIIIFRRRKEASATENGENQGDKEGRLSDCGASVDLALSGDKRIGAKEHFQNESLRESKLQSSLHVINATDNVETGLKELRSSTKRNADVEFNELRCSKRNRMSNIGPWTEDLDVDAYLETN